MAGSRISMRKRSGYAKQSDITRAPTRSRQAQFEAAVSMILR
jgi:hypothetical protein